MNFKNFYSDMADIKQRFDDASRRDRWSLIRQAYVNALPYIVEASKRSRRGSVSPYFLDWTKVLTPIEQVAWLHIRGRGIPLYPQYPEGRFFIDFASPYHKIGLELDGKQWHDEAKDRERDGWLVRHGWKVFRIPGFETATTYEDRSEPTFNEDPDSETQNWLMNTADGVIAAVGHVYFTGNPHAYSGLCLRTLDKHRLVDFELLPGDDDE